MIISNLTGGLGNQMFQYAFGRYLAIKNNVELKLHFTNALFNTQYAYALNVFNIKAKLASEKDLRRMNVVKHRAVNRLLFLLDERFGIQFNKNIITQKFPYKFDDIYQNIKDNSYVQGYWANEQYFKGVEIALRNELTSKDRLDYRNQKIIERINKTNSVSIHVRRGDLITNKRNHSFIGEDYYRKALKEIEMKIHNPTYFIFSDDIPWCSATFKKLKSAVYINHNNGLNSYKDIVLMSKCRHNIIANSTFSWWGAWLNSNPNKIIIRP